MISVSGMVSGDSGDLDSEVMMQNLQLLNGGKDSHEWTMGSGCTIESTGLNTPGGTSLAVTFSEKKGLMQVYDMQVYDI